MIESRSQTVQFVAPGALDEAVRHAITAAKGNDPMTEVTVLLPSGRAAGSAINQLASTGGVINVRCTTLVQFASGLVAGRLTNKLPLGSVVKRAVTRRVAEQAVEPLDRYERHLLANELVPVFDDLRHRSEFEIDRIGESSPMAAQLVAMYRSYWHYVSDRFVDDVDTLRAAAQQVRPGSPVVAVVHEPPAPSQLDLFAALAAAGRLYVVATPSGDKDLDLALRTWLWGLGAAPVAIDAPAKQIDSVVVVPDADTEVHVAINEMLAAANEGQSFSTMALLYTDASPYARIAEDQLRSANVPVRGGGSMQLAQSRVGGLLGQLFDVVRDPTYLSVSRLLLTLDNPRAGQWLRDVRMARVGGDIDQWLDRLEGAEVDEQFFDWLRALSIWRRRRPGTWAEWAGWAQHAIEMHLGMHSDRDDWSHVEAQAAVDVERCLAQLQILDELGAPVDFETFATTVQAELRSHYVRRAGGRNGVFVGSIGDGVGCSFDLVVVCGLTDSLYPRSNSTAGLLSQVTVPGEEMRGDRDRRLFALRCQSPGRVILTTPLADVRAQRQARPSPLLLDEVARLAGRYVDAEELINNPAQWSWLHTYVSFTQIIARPALQVSPQLDAVSALHRSDRDCVETELIDDIVGLRKAVDAIRSRDSQHLTRFDGFVRDSLSLGDDAGGAISATALETWAACPFRYLLSTVLQVEPTENEPAALVMEPRDRGNLIHEVLEQFLQSVPVRTSPAQPWSPDERSHLTDLIDNAFAKAQRKGLAPVGFITDTEKARLVRHLHTLLDADENLRVDKGVVPVAAERRFGGQQPVTIDAGKVKVKFRGRIDRVDASPDGKRVLVTDYKTGRSAKVPKLTYDATAAGTRLQLSVYSDALQKDFPAALVAADYWFVIDDESSYERKGIEYDDNTKARLIEVLHLAETTFNAGVFPAVPGEEDRHSYSNCYTCPYDQVCPKDRAEAWARKSSDDSVSSFVALSGGETT